MAEAKQTREQKVETFEEFLKILRSESIKLVRLTDYGFTAPEQRGPAVVLQPKVKLVATALDKAVPRIIRWEETRDAKQMVTIHAPTGQGSHHEGGIIAKREEISLFLESEGFHVTDGEWTPEFADTFLQASRVLL